MKTFIIAALTADGFISKNPGHSPLAWRSEGDRRFFIQKTKEAGAVVMGVHTAKTAKRPLPGRLNIIYARSAEDLAHWKEYKEWEITQLEPQELLEHLSKRGYNTLAVCGGSTIYTKFIQANVVDTLYLTIEPVLFGQGMTLFNKEIDRKLIFVTMEKLGEQSMVLEYTVKKES